MSNETNSLALDTRRVPPTLDTSAKKNPKLLIGGALAVIALGVLLFQFNPAQYRFFPFCIFHTLTGLHCAGCGATRALHQLLHGHLLAALQLNAMLVISLPLFAWHVASRMAGKVGPGRFTTKWIWFFTVVAGLFTVLRNLPWFTWLAP